MQQERIFLGSRGPIRVIVAGTVQEQSRGIHNVDDLRGTDGMLFEYAYPSSAPFWTRDTNIALSIAWFDSTGRCLGYRDAEPNSADDIPAPGIYTYVLEVPQGSIEFTSGMTLRVNHSLRYMRARDALGASHLSYAGREEELRTVESPLLNDDEGWDEP